jgi:outer membrane protein
MISKLSLAQLLQLDTFQDFDVADNTEVEEDNKILLQTPIAIYDKEGTKNRIKISPN